MMDYKFREACIKGELDKVMECLNDDTVDIKLYKEIVFKEACQCGQIAAELLVGLGSI